MLSHEARFGRFCYNTDMRVNEQKEVQDGYGGATAHTLNGVLRCSRYAFGPNRLMYCGPDANREMTEYLNDGFTDFGLIKLLKGFEVLYPYLERIAIASGIRDPFDERVVDAYWIGNALLDRIDKPTLHRHYVDVMRLKDRMNWRTWRLLEERVGHGIRANHNFHVLNVPKRMGHQEVESGVAFKDACRISWGTVTAVAGPKITVRYEPLTEQAGRLALGNPEAKSIMRQLDADYDIDMLRPGQVITMHWDTPCEVLSEEQARRLRAYTLQSIALANETLCH